MTALRLGKYNSGQFAHNAALSADARMPHARCVERMENIVTLRGMSNAVCEGTH